MKTVLRKPSPSMVVSIIALVIASAGTAIAASNVSGDKLIKKNSLSGNRLRKHTVTGTQINVGKLGKVPTASKADSATNAQSAVNARNAINATTLGGKGIRWLLVDTTGAILAQSGGFTVAKVPVGRFIVNAGSAVTRHAFIAGNAAAGASSLGQDSVAGPCGTASDGLDCSTFAGVGANDGNHFFVGTTDSTGAPHDEPFYVLMY
jgi:hypothetical protein